MSKHDSTGAMAYAYFATPGCGAAIDAVFGVDKPTFPVDIGAPDLTRKFRVFLETVKRKGYLYVLCVQSGNHAPVLHTSTEICKFGPVSNVAGWQGVQTTKSEHPCFIYRHAPEYDLAHTNKNQQLVNLLILHPVSQKVMGSMNKDRVFQIHSKKLLAIWESVGDHFPSQDD